MGIVFQNPISMSVLNKNIDGNLIFTSGWHTIYPDGNANELLVQGAGWQPYRSPSMAMYGYLHGDFPGYFKLRMGNVARTAWIDALVVKGLEDQPRLTGDCFKWVDWSSVITWSAGTPDGPAGWNYMKWMKVGQTVFVDVRLDYSDSNGSRLMSMTLPEAVASGAYTMMVGEYMSNSVESYQGYYVTTGGGNTIGPYPTALAGVDGQPIRIWFSGFYRGG